jgi:DNA-binding protein Fis
MKKQILSEEFKRMQKIAGIINESTLRDADDFAVHYGDEDFFDPFWEAIHNTKVAPNPESKDGWNKITSMTKEELIDTYELDPNMAAKIENVFANKLNEDNSNNLSIKEKVKNFLNNEIFNLEGMDDFNMREKMLNDVNNTIEEEIDEFVRRKFREERYTSSRKEQY